MPEGRENYFYKQQGDNENIAKVIYQSTTPKSSIGWNRTSFFENLGNQDRHKKGTPQQNAEQEYLLQGMVKGAIYEAAEIADKFAIGISARPTGLLAHMEIESGDPTKAQEFKNNRFGIPLGRQNGCNRLTPAQTAQGVMASSPAPLSSPIWANR